jgi:TraG-like protein, N-terminal region
MNLGVQSYPELFTTLMGWQQYQFLWELLARTGLAYAPFVVLFLRQWATPLQKEAGDPTGVQRLMLEFVGMVLVVVLAAQPLIPLNATVIHYRTVCEDVVRDVRPGDSDTTYDDAFPIATDVQIPVLWFVVMAVSQGITLAAKSTLACPLNLREMFTVVDTTSLVDVPLRQELNQFYNQCFLPARHHLFKLKRTLDASRYQALVGRYVETYGASDLNWYGSHAFSQLPGFYDAFYAKQPVHGFAYDPTRDWQQGQLASTPVWGQPSCQQWWLANPHGLKQRIIEALPASWLARFWSGLAPKDEDAILKKLIADLPKGYEAANQSINHWFPGVVSTLGVTLKQGEVYPKLYAMLQAAPMVRALLLMLLYTFLPLALVLGGYRIKTVVTAAVFLFGILFWEYLWALVQWVDDALIDALYQGFFNRQQAQAKLVDWMVIALTVVAPLFWFSFMGAVGIAAGNLSFVIMTNLTGDGEAASKQGGQLVQNTAMSAASSAIIKK